MKRKLYPSDLTDKQWAMLAPLIPVAKTGGRPRRVNLPEVVNDLFYILCGGCTWRMMPHDLPAWTPVYDYFRLWRTVGVWQQMNQALREKVRQQALWQPTPSAANQSKLLNLLAASTKMEPSWSKVTNGISGVDTLGLLRQVVVSAANMSEKAGALLILEKLVAQFPRLVKIFADGGYEGKDLTQKVKDDHHLELKAVKRKQNNGFDVLRWRWIVRHRRLSIDYEARPAIFEAFIYAAMVRVMLRRLA